MKRKIATDCFVDLLNSPLFTPSLTRSGRCFKSTLQTDFSLSLTRSGRCFKPVIKRVREEKVKEEKVIEEKEPAPALEQIQVSFPSSSAWVSATETRNYMVKDSLVDWLKLYQRTTEVKQPQLQARSNSSPESVGDWQSYLLKRGQDFEKELVNFLNLNHLPIYTVVNPEESNLITPANCQKTITAMQQGHPVIYSAPFRNPENQTQGVIDLLIRSDYLQNLFQQTPITDNFPAPNLSSHYHYVVIDIKFSTLPLRSNGVNLLNAGNYPAYKAQLWIYTQGIGHIQGYTPRYAYILGRRWTYICKDEKYSGQSCLDRLGVIDYEGIDQDYKQRTNQAIDWVRQVRTEGKNWSVSPPSRPELWPNMCIDSGKWNTLKKQIANDIGDITQIWYCGDRQRQIAFNKGITSWRDKRCVSRNLGMYGLRAPVIDKILAINRQNRDKIRPKKIRSRMFNWSEAGNEIFVDFETLCDIFASFDQLPEQGNTGMIFMIGIYIPATQSYISLRAKQPTKQEEYRIMDEFVSLYNSLGQPRIWYWHAENSLWENAENSQMDLACEQGDIEKSDHIVDDWKISGWSDMAQLFRTEPIVIKDCFKFGLKEVAEAMYKHGMISAHLSGSCHSGLDASILAWLAYQGKRDHSIFRDIAEYNRFDVEVLYQILSYLRREMR